MGKKSVTMLRKIEQGTGLLIYAPDVDYGAVDGRFYRKIMVLYIEVLNFSIAYG